MNGWVSGWYDERVCVCTTDVCVCVGVRACVSGWWCTYVYVQFILYVSVGVLRGAKHQSGPHVARHYV